MKNNEYILLHQFIKSSIQLNGFFGAVDICKNIYNSTEHCIQSKATKIFSKISRLIEKLKELDQDGAIVTSCLSIALLVHLLLSLNNINSELKIGVNLVNDVDIISHAWVESINKMFNEESEKYYEITSINIMEE